MCMNVFTNMERQRDCKKMAHAIMEADQPHALQSASWRPRRAGGLPHQRTRGWGPGRLPAEVPVHGRKTWSSPEQMDRDNSSLLHLLFSSGLQGMGEAHPYWEGCCAAPSPLIQMLILPRNPSRISLEKMFDQISGHPVTQSDT